MTAIKASSEKKFITHIFYYLLFSFASNIYDLCDSSRNFKSARSGICPK